MCRVFAGGVSCYTRMRICERCVAAAASDVYKRQGLALFDLRGGQAFQEKLGQVGIMLLKLGAG